MRHYERRHKLVVRMSASLALALAIVVVLLPLIVPANQTVQPMSAKDVKLQATRKIYRIDQAPTFSLHMLAAAPDNALGWMGVGKVYAAVDNVQTSVSYNDKKITMPVSVQSTSRGQYKITLQPQSQIKPGKYSLTVTVKTASGQAVQQVQNFAWGVLAINTTKPAYQPGETAKIQMAVLSSTGKTLCQAPLQLTVTNPSGQVTTPTIEQPKDCHADAYTEVPDYSATYKVGEAGTYAMKVQLAGSDYSLADTFKVVNHEAFSIERSAPTRLFPPSPYTMKLRVAASQDFRGTVTETLPAGFTVIDAGGATATKATTSNGQMLRWRVDWHKGEIHELSYRFKAPKVSPAFYFFRPLTLKVGNHTVYQEQRSWQMAGDAVITYIKDTAEYQVSPVGTTYTSSVTSTTGNTLILMMHIGVANATTPQLTGVTDSAGNSWVLPTGALPVSNPPAYTQGTSTSHMVMAYALNAAAVTSVTFTLGGSYTFNYDIAEFSNIASTSAVDQSDASGGALSTSQSTPTLATLNANDLIIGGIFSGGNAGAITLNTAGYTQLQPTSSVAANVRLGLAYQVVSATGSYSINFTLGTARAVASGLMAFKTDSGGGGGGGSCTVTAPSIAFVQQAEQNSGANATSMTTSFPSASTSGNLLVALVSVRGGTANAGAAISSVTDSAGNSWTYPTADPQDNPFAQAASGSNSYIAIAYAAGASAASSVTVNLSVSLPVAVVIAEFSGVATSSPVDISKGQVGAASTTPTTPTIATTNANDLIIGAVSETTTPAISRTTSGYTDFPLMTAANDPFDGGSAWQVVSATGNYSVAWSAPGNHEYGSGIIAFKQASSSTTPSMNLMMRGGNYFCNGSEQGFFWAS